MKKQMEEMQKQMEEMKMEKQQRQQAGGSSGDGDDQDDPTSKAIVYKSDTLEMIKKLPPAEYDLLYTNPPFGITGAAWDQALDWDALWPEIWRVLKPNGAVVPKSPSSAPNSKWATRLRLCLTTPRTRTRSTFRN
eukprot:SAG22_NODE_3448_length_1705_cov_10.592777_3_plen_134_part_01